MFKAAFLILLFAHILGDFYFQSDRLAEEKNIYINKVFKHSAVYAALCIILAVPFLNVFITSIFILMAVSHFIIDLLKFFYIKKITEKSKLNQQNQRIIYIADQLIHLAVIAVLAIIFSYYNETIIIPPFISSVFTTIGISASTAFSWLLVFLLIWKPANITIKKLIKIHKPDNNQIGNEEIKTGSFIGLLERIIIIILLSINQYSAIGLVLTAKSIARYKRIAEEQAFAEYYLLGTLLSTITVLVSYILVF